MQRNTKDGTVSTGKLSLVDLAGSEMVKKTQAKGERQAPYLNLGFSPNSRAAARASLLSDASCDKLRSSLPRKETATT